MPELKNRMLKMKGPLPSSDIFLNKAEVIEGLSKHTEIRIDIMSPDVQLDLADMVGQPFSVSIKVDESTWRHFHGYAIELSTLGISGKYAHYQATLRSWPYLLSLNSECRIYQDMNAMDIIKDVIQRNGFMPDFEDKTSGTTVKREYCVQYRESDFDFISRLMEEEGIYYHFDHEENKHKMVLSDSAGKHTAIKYAKAINKDVKENTLPYYDLEESGFRKNQDHIFDWSAREAVVLGKVTLSDYEFTTSATDLKVAKYVNLGKHKYNKKEKYDYQGRYSTTTVGEELAKIRLEAEQVRYKTKNGICNARTMATGYTFTLDNHLRGAKEDGEYLVTGARYILQIDPEEMKKQPGGAVPQDLPGQIEVDEENVDAFRCWFSCIPKATQFRAPLTTPWPEISGVLTALVVGKSGEEIHVDEHGRIRVQFYWDRLGKKNETSTCWIRHMSPWSGKNWGMIHIPRIGQEVVVQFEDGNPDRPLVMGMLYNDQCKPPYALDANKTESGIVTRSTKSGSKDTFHELMFKDEKEKELVRFQSERDYKQTIKNNADITIGLEHKDKGNLTQTIHNDKTETLNEGNDKLQIKKGNQTTLVDKGDQTITIGTGSQTQSIKKDQTETIEGKSKRDVTGNHDETIKSGNWTTKISAGKGEMEAAQSFEIKVGSSSIKLTPASIEIKSTAIKIQSTGMTEVKAGGAVKVEASGMAKVKAGGMMQVEAGGIAQVKAGGILMLQGSMTKIN